MQLPILTLPRAVPVQRERQPKENIPQTRAQRESIRARLRQYVVDAKLVAPLSIADLRKHAQICVQEQELAAIYTDYVGVLLNSEVWRDQLARVPYQRRLLLLPKCMRIEDKCPAPFDEFGLLCKQCGLCTIQELQEEAERLGYAVLVAEGSALVMAIIETGKIDAIVGVSCLSVLEKAFPYMESAAIPGVAIPLLQDDCKDVTVDLEWIWETIHLTSDDTTYRLNLDSLRGDVKEWFSDDSLEEIMGPAPTQTEKIARAWLAKNGKRWRPFLTACVWKSMVEDSDTPVPLSLKKLAVAAECFHKASLVHDDIEDNDDFRYGEPSLHSEQGVAVALNVGDLLLGDGYALIADCDLTAQQRIAITRVAASGHRTLCLGQGAEFQWAKCPGPLSCAEVLDIFRKKTATAFEVALQFGALAAGCEPKVCGIISRFSDALGIAYQIRDDLEDMTSSDSLSDLEAMRPSLPLALLHERVRGQAQHRQLVDRAWRKQCSATELAEVEKLFAEYQIADRCKVLQESYKEEAIRCLTELENPSVKGLLRRVISKIFTVEVKDWCSEFETRNAASRSPSPQVAG
ncbi:MAG: polyprenyl synthetase family protein [Planctomycetes bacterium]|nr:polyprenyl synthetase family protein [Planctomycetota bacterium]